ncbi:phytanoyl-CoA dioxygenase family protein [Microtetraspora niveoalba]|uniref:phytanoyl-CoA dioxygenase family protein n=1 Tax=Microtetraspora niveoalba TaxID=46175 RepID=UPI00082FDE16|nr:phytanoyl-CoA dioxygenase family protein [Microtetraspora niveoalba]
MSDFDAAAAERFAADGFLKVEEAFPRETGERAQALLWKRLGLAPDRPEEWTRPVVWLEPSGEGALGEVTRGDRLTTALDLLIGPGGWAPRPFIGMTPVRFPHPEDSGDTGWHIDQNRPGPDGAWGVATGWSHTFLLLLLFSEVGPDDAPTRIRVGSHRDTARVLEPYGEEGVPFFESGPILDEATAHRPEALATGLPGDAFICHPLLVHAAQRHRGTRPRFMSQIPMFLTTPLSPGGSTPLDRSTWNGRV